MKRLGPVLFIFSMILVGGLLRANPDESVEPANPLPPPIILATGEEVKRTVLRAAGAGLFPEDENDAKALLKARSSARREALLQLARMVGFKPRPEDGEGRYRADLKGARAVKEEIDTDGRRVVIEMEISLETVFANLTRPSAAQRSGGSKEKTGHQQREQGATTEDFR
ncbi:MAG: hypothetical protein IT210_23670 [Armatimonadetes bacterium]|nr:hypothetical protein [Armatimonadota bacterium]